MTSSLISQRASSLSVSPIREFFELALRIENVIRLEIGEPDFPVPLHIKEAARRAIDGDYSHYTSSVGLFELRRSVAAKMARENDIAIDPEKEVIITHGATLPFTSPCWRPLIPETKPCSLTLDGLNTLLSHLSLHCDILNETSGVILWK